MLKKNKRAILVCGGYIPSQMLYLIPIINSYCEKKKISTILFHDPLPSLVQKNKYVRNWLNRHDIIYLNDVFSYSKVSLLEKLLIIFKSLQLSLMVSRTLLLNNFSWKYNQLIHSVWDLSMLNSNKEELSPNFSQKLKASYKINTDMFTLEKAIENFTIDTTFIGHTVYQDRGKLAILREKSAKIYAFANFCFYQLPKKYDTAWNMPENKILKLIISKIKKRDVSQYWDKRIKGKGDYEDSVIASKIITKKNASPYPKNVILLHIFKDSPFNLIDTSRIYSDYVDWIIETLKIVSESNEKWAIRYHPNARRWGENQKAVIKKIYELNNFKSINNLIIDDQSLSNNELFLKVKKVVTFSGTPHLEAACFGIKPIVIRSVAMSKYRSNLVFKVKNKKEYKKLLLADSNSKKFKLSTQDKILARKLLFMQEKVIPFKISVSGSSLYRNDSKYTIRKEFDNVKKNLQTNEKYLRQLGRILASGASHTINKPYLYLIDKQRVE